MFEADLVNAAIDPAQDRDDKAKTRAVAALRVMNLETPADFEAACSRMDEEDARSGERERRSQALRGRLTQLRDEDAESAAEQPPVASVRPPAAAETRNLKKPSSPPP